MACILLGTFIEKARGTAAICHPLQKVKDKNCIYKINLLMQ